MYKGPYQAGSVSDFNTSISDYFNSQPGCYEFKGYGVGRYECVKNNAESIWNRTSRSVRVHYNSGFKGASQSFFSGQRANLNSTLKDDNASHIIIVCRSSAEAIQRVPTC